MTSEWRPIDGIDPEEATFPLRTALGGEKIVVFREGDDYWAVERYCPHQHTDFSRGAIVGNGTMIRCGLHAYTFNLSDGSGVNCPGYTINIYEVRREGTRLLGRPITTGDYTQGR